MPAAAALQSVAMPNLLVINASGRVTRSITRHLTHRLTEAWHARVPGGAIVHRDVGTDPPPAVDEPWIAAAFADPSQRPDVRPLAISDALIDELDAADVVVLGTPIYNFGMPAQLKAYFDQIIRVGRTFAFDPGEAEPYRPLLRGKPVVIITSAGDGSMNPGGALHHLNFLDPHLEVLLGFIGLTDLRFIRVGYDEFQDARLKASLAAAERAVDELAAQLTAGAANKLAS